MRSQMDPWHMVTSFVQYTLLAPSYINILNVYAVRSTPSIAVPAPPGLLIHTERSSPMSSKSPPAVDKLMMLIIRLQRRIVGHERRQQGQHGPRRCQGEQGRQRSRSSGAHCRDGYQRGIRGRDTCAVDQAAEGGEKGRRGDGAGGLLSQL